MKPKFCPDNCIHLDLTEEDQEIIGSKNDHHCARFKSRLFHFSYHPNIVRHDRCPGPEFKGDELRIQEYQKLANVPSGASTGACSLSGSSTGFGLNPGLMAAVASGFNSIRAEHEANLRALEAWKVAGEHSLRSYEHQLKMKNRNNEK